MGTVVLPKLSQTGANEWADVEDNDKALRDEFNGNIENVNIKSSAAIAHSKLAATTAGYVLLGNASNVTTATQVTGDVTISSSGVTTVAATYMVPAARAASAGTTSVASSTATAIALDGETYDTDGMHSNVTNNTRITAITAGIYNIVGEVSFPDMGVIASNVLTVSIRINGSGSIGQQKIQCANDAGPYIIQASATYNFSANDYIEIVATHVGGTAYNLSAKLAMTWASAAS